MTSSEYWTLDELAQLMRIMGDNDCTALEIGEIKIYRQLKIDLQTQSDAREPTDDEILEDPYAGL